MRILQRLKCFLGRHDVDPKHVILELGAVFHGGICRLCLKPWIGRFICNAWDESKTGVKDGTVYLQGINPIILREGYKMIGYKEELFELSRELLKAAKK